MISAELNGGLGNQMFQIATTYVLALQNGDQCGFNFANKPMFQGQWGNAYRRNIFKKLRPLPPRWRPVYIYRERGLGYQRIPYYKKMLLRGYFSDERYFGDYRKEIVKLFSDEETIKLMRESYYPLLKNSASYHVRRGDYMQFPDVYVTLGEDYYGAALKHIESRHKIENILVFSDDIQWCKENLSDPRMTFVEDQPDYMDLYLMSLCDHNIMANSSFSWWGAYLNTNPDKIVCAPRIWFKDKGPANAEHLFCKNWHLI